MRGGLVAGAVACSVVAGITTGGWALQVIGLPPPSRADRVVARALTWLLRYRLVQGRFRIGNGTPIRSECFQAWLPVLRGGKPGRATLLAMSTGRTIIATHGRVRLVGAARREPRGLALVQLELAGCPRIDGALIAAVVERGRLSVDRAVIAGRPALAIHARSRRSTLTLYVTGPAWKPFATAVRSRRFCGVGFIRLTRLTPPLLDSLLARAGL